MYINPKNLHEVGTIRHLYICTYTGVRDNSPLYVRSGNNGSSWKTPLPSQDPDVTGHVIGGWCILTTRELYTDTDTSTKNVELKLII